MNMEKSIKGSFAERGLRFLRNVHLLLGAAALAGSLIFTEFVALPAIAAYEFINAGVHELARQAIKSRGASKPQPA